jgi:transposase InsO family protein
VSPLEVVSKNDRLWIRFQPCAGAVPELGKPLSEPPRIFGVTAPTNWVMHSAVGFCMIICTSPISRTWSTFFAAVCIVRDRDSVYGEIFIRRVRAMGIRDRPISARSPWQNGYAERVIGSIRRDCLDHVVVFGERHLRHLLASYRKYYNGARTHLSLGKDAPHPRAVQAHGHILTIPALGGLHHQYCRA